MSTSSGLFELNTIQKEEKNKVNIITIEKDGEQYAVINREVALLATGDRVFIKEDPFRTGNECPTCDGLGHDNTICKNCNGTGYDKADSDRGDCIICAVGNAGLRKTLKHTLCNTCKGSGTTSIIIPEDSERRPSSGVIISIGPDVNFHSSIAEGRQYLGPRLKVGDRVLYSNYAGTTMNFKGKDAIRIIRQDEVMSKLFAVSEKSVITEEVADTRLKEVGINQDGI